ncbi:cyclic nucleotide-binding domain-containing protein [Legionella israelensis]|nr:cyclic nucleotide-binding domain-containing protein [Legionella israelensis]
MSRNMDSKPSKNSGLKRSDKAKKSSRQITIVQALRKSELFGVLDEESLQQISNVAHQSNVNAGETIVKEGEPSDRIFLIVNGIAEVKKHLTNESEKILAYLMPGNTFGETGVLENKPRSVTVVALSDVELIEVHQALFKNLLMTFPQLGIELSRLLGHYLIQTNNRLIRGSKDKRLLVIFKFGRVKSAELLSKSIAEKINNKTEQPTIFINYTGRAKSLKLTHQFQIERSSTAYDVLLNGKTLKFPSDSRISMIVDRLLDTYDNLIIYFANLPKENLALLFEYLTQMIILTDKPNYSASVAWMEKLREQLRQEPVESFILLEEKNSHQNPINYHFMGKHDLNNGKLTFSSTINILTDRLKRNNRIAIFIPITSTINHADTSTMINETLKFLGNIFGGATSKEAAGVWKNQDVKKNINFIQEEKIFMIYSYTTGKALRNNLHKVVEFAKTIKNSLQQESLAIEINNKLILI